MKAGFPILIILTVLNFSCKQTKNQESNPAADTLSTSEVVSPEKNNNEEQPKPFDAFKSVFVFEDKKEGVKQTLGATWFTTDSIEFRLLTEDNICDTDFWGTAINNYPDGDPEIDEDEGEEAYASEEYVIENNDYYLQIKIALDRSKATVVYQDRTELDTDCIPSSNLVLINNNTH